MPFYHKPRSFKPLSHAAESRSVKNGVHHAIFTSRFDKYVGDWRNDLKEGAYRKVLALRNHCVIVFSLREKP